MIVISLLKIWSSCEEDAGKMYKKNGDDEEKDGKDKKMDEILITLQRGEKNVTELCTAALAMFSNRWSCWIRYALVSSARP